MIIFKGETTCFTYPHGGSSSSIACVRNGAVESPKSLSYAESLARIFSQKEHVSHNMTISMVKVLQSYHTTEEENGYYEKMDISSVMESSNTIIPIPPN